MTTVTTVTFTRGGTFPKRVCPALDFGLFFGLASSPQILQILLSLKDHFEDNYFLLIRLISLLNSIYILLYVCIYLLLFKLGDELVHLVDWQYKIDCLSISFVKKIKDAVSQIDCFKEIPIFDNLSARTRNNIHVNEMNVYIPSFFIKIPLSFGTADGWIDEERQMLPPLLGCSLFPLWMMTISDHKLDVAIGNF